MRRKESGSADVYLNALEIYLDVWSDKSWLFLFGAGDLVPEVGGGYGCPTPEFADYRCPYEDTLGLLEC